MNSWGLDSGQVTQLGRGGTQLEWLYSLAIPQYFTPFKKIHLFLKILLQLIYHVLISAV